MLVQLDAFHHLRNSYVVTEDRGGGRARDVPHPATVMQGFLHGVSLTVAADSPVQMLGKVADRPLRQPGVRPEACIGHWRHHPAERRRTPGTWQRRWALASTVSGSMLRRGTFTTRESHSQHSLRAKPMTHKSGTPRPPRSLGEQVMRQATRHFPPVVLSVPVQRKAQRRESIC
jgi:hypothetical protein